MWPQADTTRGRTTAAALAQLIARWHPLLVAVCCLLPFGGLLLPDGRVLPEFPWCDYASYQLPIRRFARDELLAGRFPLWVPYLGCGMPLHAGQQASLCHPLVTPLVLLCGAEVGLKWCLFSHLAILFAGTYWLARSLRASRPASCFAALAATWSGANLGHLMAGHVTIVLECALVPWFFLALAALLRRPGPLTAAALGGIVAGFAFCGQPQILYYTLLAGSLWAAGSLACGEAAPHRARSTAWGSVAAPRLRFLTLRSRPHPARLDGEGDRALPSSRSGSYSPSRRAGWGLSAGFPRRRLAHHLAHHPHKADGVHRAQHQNLRFALAFAQCKPREGSGSERV